MMFSFLSGSFLLQRLSILWPPGTGKTLVARALASEYSRSDRKISFFIRNASDCMRKYVGESERQLRVLFEQVRLKCAVDSVRVETIIFCGQRF